MPQALEAKVFRNGRSQAVRIPAEFRFTSDQVYIEKKRGDRRDFLIGKAATSDAAELFARLDAEGPFEFELDRDMHLPEEREIFESRINFYCLIRMR